MLWAGAIVCGVFVGCRGQFAFENIGVTMLCLLCFPQGIRQ